MGVPQVNPFTIFSSGLLLVLKVKGDEMISQLVWQKRCTGVEHGLQTGLPGTKKKVYRTQRQTQKLTPEIAVKVKKKLTESKQGWTTKQPGRNRENAFVIGQFCKTNKTRS